MTVRTGLLMAAATVLVLPMTAQAQLIDLEGNLGAPEIEFNPGADANAVIGNTSSNSKTVRATIDDTTATFNGLGSASNAAVNSNSAIAGVLGIQVENDITATGLPSNQVLIGNFTEQTGKINSTITDSEFSVDIGAGGIDATGQVNGTDVSSEATASLVTNVITGDFAGLAGTGAANAAEIDGTQGASTIELTTGNIAIANVQEQVGTVTSTIDTVDVSVLSAGADADSGDFEVLNTDVDSLARGNIAGNVIDGDNVNASNSLGIFSVQNNTGPITSTVTDATMSIELENGLAADSSANVSNNSVTSTAIGNHVINRISGAAD